MKQLKINIPNGFKIKSFDEKTGIIDFESIIIDKEVLKINSKDNTITIRKVKDSWSREELVKLISDFAEYTDNFYRPYTRDNIEVWNVKDKWIKENL